MTFPTTDSPASKPADVKKERRRVPMSLPVQKLAVPAIPGYHLHWMLGTPQRLAQAHQAWYEFVDHSEVDLATVGLGNSADSQGSTDLGSRVSLVAGGMSEGGQATRLYLMKVKQELWEEDQRGLEARKETIAAVLRGDSVAGDGQNTGDTSNRYTPRGLNSNNLFVPKVRRP